MYDILSVFQCISFHLRTIVIVGICVHQFMALAAPAQSPIVSPTLTTDLRQTFIDHCGDCHSDDLAEGEINLVAALDGEFSQQVVLWQRSRDMLRRGQMPPRDADILPQNIRVQMLDWITAQLRVESRRNPGDPGPVALRRLSNAEYTYSIQDLTNVSTLQPTSEFPADGAAGEGFSNTGMGQAMSPAMIDKYFQAAQSTAARLVLLPDGFRFSQYQSRSDQVTEIVEQIQTLYHRYSDAGGGSTVNFDGQNLVTNDGGRLPLDRYLKVLAAAELEVVKGGLTYEQLARQHGLSPKYLRRLADVLTNPNSDANPWIDSLRRRWQSPNRSTDEIVLQIQTWQKQWWKFNVIGHLGRQGGPTTWMESVEPLSKQFVFNIPLSSDWSTKTVQFDFSRSEWSSEQAQLEWSEPKVDFASGKAALYLSDSLEAAAMIRNDQKELLRSSDYIKYLLKPPALRASHSDLRTDLLQAWANWLGLSLSGKPIVTGHLADRLENVAGHSAICGWGRDGGTTVLVNQSESPISFLTLAIPARQLVVHPTPSTEAVIQWQAPQSGVFDVRLEVKDQDPQCGNGIELRLEKRTQLNRQVLLNQTIENGGRLAFTDDDVANNELRSISLEAGEILMVVVSPRNRDHSCDTTQIQFQLVDKSTQEKWDLAADVVDRIHKSNPVPGPQNSVDVWHFCEQSLDGEFRPKISAESILGKILEAASRPQTNDSELQKLLVELDRLATNEQLEEFSAIDRELCRELYDWFGPLNWLSIAQGNLELKIDPNRWKVGDPRSNRLPAEMLKNGSLRTTVNLKPGGNDSEFATPICRIYDNDQRVVAEFIASQVLMVPGTPGANKLSEQLAEVRELFPPALCYERIVPVDEVVTLTLYYREDEWLQRLMLNEAEIAELKRLWQELWFVAQEPLGKAVAFEQIAEFATQDRPDLVIEFRTIGETIKQRAEEFKQELLDSQAEQWRAVRPFAERAWRRSLSDEDELKLRHLYDQLHSEGVDHESAMRLVLTRILTAPAFLFKLEHTPTAVPSARVSDAELATRLSYFLWSSLPDDPLRELSSRGELSKDQTLREQTARMLCDDRVARLAREFGAQWLHVRNFAENNEKSETLFPEFAELRQAMAHEVELYFEYLFRNDRSILDLLDSDYTFVDARLAQFYGFAGDDQSEFHRVGGVRTSNRGGIVTMAAVLANQSGASRTSPILRGNWVYETLLGEKLPNPPPGVPQLPETLPTGLSERELIEQHSSRAECASCHRLIDPYGFALEQFDAIGRNRSAIVNTDAVLDSGQTISGAQGLKKYLLEQRRDDFVKQFCRKLLGYALGREIILSDEMLLEEMQRQLSAQEYRVSAAVEAIVTSRQFREIRGPGNGTTDKGENHD